MYFNNVHIMFYVGIAVLGLIIGKIVAWTNICIPQKKKIFSKEYFKARKEGIEKSHRLMLLMAIIYIALLYKFGIKETFFKNLDLVKFVILTPMLVSSFFIDLKHRILPNRINLTMFETGLVIAFAYGITNINMAKDMILGMFAGALIFIVIMLLGKLLSGKDAMGLGDIKFMGALGLFFGVSKIAEIALAGFFISAIFSLVILFIRAVILKSKDEYIPFGPALIIAAFLSIFLPTNTIFTIFIGVCTTFSDKIIELIS